MSGLIFKPKKNRHFCRCSYLNSRLLHFVADSLPMKLNSVTCWTDSMVTLHWIRKPSSTWKMFVANRVGEIQAAWDPVYWRHCPGKDNPSDLLTRGSTAEDLQHYDLWWSGPDWLQQTRQHWLHNEPTEPKEALEECKSEGTHAHVAVTMETVIDSSRYSTWQRLIRVMC